jgi:tetratricopeptide (TPR) repeat protein
LNSVDGAPEAEGVGGVHAPDAAGNGVGGGARDVVQVRDVHGSMNLVHYGPAQLGPPALPVPRQLPHDVRGLVGREDQLRWLDRMLHQGTGGDPPASTISVVSGMPGTGKTSLALRWAHRVRAMFPDGQLYADLCGYSVEHPEFTTRVLDRFLRALGIPDSRVPPDIQEKEGLYRSLLADRRVLVVLDNAATAAQVRPLLPGSSECVVVITSRSRLAGIEGAGYLTLEALRHEDAVALLRNMLQGRTDDDADLGELAVACAQLPLALRIAGQRAAHRPMTPLTDLLSALRDSSERWRALSMDNGDEAEAVHTVFAWSYYALPPGTARFFRLLGLHPGPDLRIEAAAALAGVTLDEAREAMEALSDAHLVEQPCARRYRLHDLVNAYAKDRAEAQETADEIEAARRRVIEWYLQGSYDASQHMDLSCQHPLEIEVSKCSVDVPEMPDRQAAAQWCEQEWLNLVAAVETAAESGFLVLVWQMAATLRFMYLRADRRDAGLAVQREALQAARELRDLWAEATILDGLSVAYTHFGQCDESRVANAAAIGIWQQLGDGQREAVSKTNHSVNLIGSRDWKRAIRYVREIITTTEQVAYRRIYGVNLGNLGECLLELGQLARAGDMVTEALAIHREFDWDMGIADTLWNLSRITRARSRMADALAYAREAVQRAKLTTDTNLQGRTMLELAVVLQGNRMYDESMAVYQVALDHARSAGDRVVEARVLERVAVLHHERGNLQSARVSHELSIDISREIGDRWYLALSLDRFAETMDRLGRDRDARAARLEALELFKEFDEPRARAAGDRLSAALAVG